MSIDFTRTYVAKQALVESGMIRWVVADLWAMLQMTLAAGWTLMLIEELPTSQARRTALRRAFGKDMTA